MNEGISHSGLLALIWAGTGAATALTLGRTVIRMKRFKKLLWDDVFQLLSWALMLATNITFTLFLPIQYRLAATKAGELNLQPTELLAIQITTLKYTLSLRLIFWTCLWAAKGAFLALYRQLFNPSRSFVRVWWVVLTFTVITYFVCVAGVLTACGSASDLLNLEKCNSNHWGGWYLPVMFEYTTVVNVLSDIAIMYLALWKTWGLNMRMSQKLSLSSIYCLVVALMVFDIVRIVESIVYRSWTRSTFFDILEVVLVVIVTALPGYRIAFTGRWLDDTFQRITSLTLSSKRSIISHLGRKPSRDIVNNDQKDKGRESESISLSHSLEPLKTKEAGLGFPANSMELRSGDESFRACIEGV